LRRNTRGGTFGYKEILFTYPLPEFLTKSPEFTEWNRDFSTRADGSPEFMDLPEGSALKNLFPNHVYWSANSEAHWPGEFNIVAHLRSDIRIIDGEYSVFGDEFQSDWQTEHDETFSGLKLLNFAINDPEKFFSLDYDGFVESGISGDVLKFLGRDEREREGKSLNEYYTILQDKYGIGVALTGDARVDLIEIIEAGDLVLDNPDLFDLSEATPLAKIVWGQPEYTGPLGEGLKSIKEALRKRYQVLGNAIDKSNAMGSDQILDWADLIGDKQNTLQIINQAMEDLPKSPYARTKDWTKLIAEQQLLTAANEGYNSISWSSGDLKIKTNPGELSEAKLRLVYDKEMKNQVIRSLKSLGVSKEDIDIKRVPYDVKVPTQGEIPRLWPTVRTYVWKLSLTPKIIELIMKIGFKVSKLDPSKGGLLGQKTERELYA